MNAKGRQLISLNKYLCHSICTSVSALSINSFKLQLLTKSTYEINSNLRKLSNIIYNFNFRNSTENVLFRHHSTENVKEDFCWNCKKSVKYQNNLFCDLCGVLQDVNSEINYFQLMKFPEEFSLNHAVLKKRFLSFQSLVHPDKFSNKPLREQINSAEWSSLINKAYKTLSFPIERGVYLLKLRGELISEDNTMLNKALLMEVMERNEEVEGASTEEDLKDLQDKVSRDFNEQSNKLEQYFHVNDLSGAKDILTRLKYLKRIGDAIKNKLQSIL